MKKSWHMERRAFLKGVGVAMALPYLDVMADTKKTDIPKRFCSIYFPYGVSTPSKKSSDRQWAWFPNNPGRNFTLNNPLSPLEKLRNKITVIGGMSHVAARRKGGHSGGNYFLTGHHQVEKKGNSMSLDQKLIKHLGEQTYFPSLSLATDSGIYSGGNQTRTLSFNQYGQGIPSIGDPKQIYDLLFSTVKQKANLKNDVNTIDKVLEHSKLLIKNLGKADKEKMEEYMESVRSIEKRIARAKLWANVELKDVKKDQFNLTLTAENADPEEYYRCIYDLMAIALQSDRTRILTYMTGSNHSALSVADKFVAKTLGKIGGLGHHRIIHAKKYQIIGQWDKFLTKQFKYFLTKLDSMKEQESSVLDKTIVLYGSASSVTHVNQNYPLIVAGGSDFKIPHNQYIHYQKEVPMSNLLYGISKKFGIRDINFEESTGDSSDILGRMMV